MCKMLLFRPSQQLTLDLADSGTLCLWQNTAAQVVSSRRWNCFGKCRSTRPLRRKLGISNKQVFCSGAEDALQA